jgi:hypothetical protein
MSNTNCAECQNDSMVSLGLAVCCLSCTKKKHKAVTKKRC